MDEQPDRVRLPVAGLRLRGRELRLDRPGLQRAATRSSRVTSATRFAWSSVASNAGGSSSATSAATAIGRLRRSDPVVVAVGDIACAPGDTSNSSNCQQAMTASLAAAQHPDAVLPLGDNQYNSGLLSEYTGRARMTQRGACSTRSRIRRRATTSTRRARPRRATSATSARRLAARPRPPRYYSYNLGHVAHRLARLELQRLWLRGRRARRHHVGADVVAAVRPGGAPGRVHARVLASPALLGELDERQPRTGPLFSALYNAHADIVRQRPRPRLRALRAAGPERGRRRATACDNSLPGPAARTCSRSLTNPPNLQMFDQSDFGVLVLTLHATSYDWAFKRLEWDGRRQRHDRVPRQRTGAPPRARRACRTRVAGWPDRSRRCASTPACNRPRSRPPSVAGSRWRFT